MNEILARIGEIGLVPVIKLESADQALPLGEALVAGGIPVAEITFRTQAAAASIRALRSALPGLLVGAGTVLSVEQAETAFEAGARFIVSPSFNSAVVDWCLARGLPVLPGVTGPEGIERGMERGLELFKFFPAEAAGGVRYIKAVAAPYREVRFVPTGGVTAANLAEYLGVPAVVACGGTWIAPPDAIREHRWEAIASAAAEAVSIGQGGRPA